MDDTVSMPGTNPTGSGGTASPLVSIVIPAFNAEKFVLDAIRSVESQDYKAIEVLLVDDGSTDRTVDLVRSLAPQVRIISQENAGAAAARNTGLKNANGDLVCFLDADDGWFPGKLRAQVRYLERHPEAGVAYHRWIVRKADAAGQYAPPLPSEVPSDGDEVDWTLSGWIYPKLLLSCHVHTSTVMMRREVVERIGYFDTGLVTGEDYDYWLRVSRRYQIHKLTGTYSYYRETAGSLTNSFNSRNNEYDVISRAVKSWGLTSPDGSSISEEAIAGRLSALAFGFGYGHYHYGSMAQARDSFRLAWQHQPLRWRAIVYLMLASLRMRWHDGR